MKAENKIIKELLNLEISALDSKEFEKLTIRKIKAQSNKSVSQQLVSNLLVSIPTFCFIALVIGIYMFSVLNLYLPDGLFEDVLYLKNELIKIVISPLFPSISVTFLTLVFLDKFLNKRGVEKMNFTH